MRRWLTSYFGFCYHAFKEESKRSKGYILASVIPAISFLIPVIEWAVNSELKPPSFSGKTRAILLLTGFTILLLIVIEAIRRYHERIVSELDDEWTKQANFNEKIGEFAGECMYYGVRKEIPLDQSRRLIENARQWLEDNLGEPVANKFFNPQKDKIPEDDLARVNWMQGRAVSLRNLAYKQRVAASHKN